MREFKYPVPAKNKSEMSDTNIILPQSAIPLLGVLPARICYLLVPWLGPVRGYLWRRLRRSSQQVLQKVKSRD